MKNSNWVTLGRKTIFESEPYLRVEMHQVQLPTGKVIEDWPWIESPDYVNIAALTESKHVLVFRQFKYAVKEETLAAVGGYLLPGEDPLTGAKRELLEETGFAADNWKYFGKFVVDGNRGNGHAHLFLAQDAHKVTGIVSDDLEDQELLFLTQDQVKEALAEGEFKCLPWQTVMSLALLFLEQ